MRAYTKQVRNILFHINVTSNFMEIVGEEKIWAGGWMDMAADRTPLRVSFINFMQTIHEISFIKNDHISIFEILYPICI
jgi:hypothetical protein